ncbi:MAG: Succinoglycan biosynthesis protein exoa [Micavibrio sp.]|nr:Succinoglycan biosynthesis protein exoa [Micavibrio sp.]
MTETATQHTAKVLAVIPCLNEAYYLASLVDHLVQDAAATALPLTIAIVDGGSTDGTVGIAQALCARYPSVTLLHNKARIQSAAVNLAVASTDADFIIRVDAHAGYPDGFCAALIAEQKKINADSVVVSMETIGNPGFQAAVAAAQNSKLGNGGSAHRNSAGEGCWVDHGHHALMRVSAFRAVGGYDETFSHNEDAELDLRLRKAGFKIWLCGGTSILYYPRSSPLPLFRQYFNFGKGRARTTLKHRARPRLRQLAPTAVAPAAALALLTPFTALAAFPLLAWAFICIAYGLKIGLRADDRSLFAAGPAIMLMHSGWSFGFWCGVAGEVLKRKGSQ